MPNFHTKANPLSRREFIKMGAALAVTGFVTALAPVPGLAMSSDPAPDDVLFNGRTYRLTLDGRLLAAGDILSGGWTPLANFGPNLHGKRLVVNQNELLAELSTGGKSFFLKSKDGKAWHTAEWSKPSGRLVEQGS